MREAHLSTERRLGASEEDILAAQCNLARAHAALGRLEESRLMRRDVYSGFLKLGGEESIETITAASNYAATLIKLNRFEETKSLMRKTIPVARRVFGDCNDLTLKMRQIYARALYEDPAATLDDLHEAVTTLEEAGRTAQRVFGGAHPLTTAIGEALQYARAALAARETPPSTPSENV